MLLGVWFLWSTIKNGHDPMTRLNPKLERMSEQNLSHGDLVPGFLLPDQHGKMVGLSHFPGRILLIALWSPSDPDSALLLSHLDSIHKKYEKQGVLPVAICLSEDTGAATTFAQGEKLAYPVVYDWGTHNASKQMESSPIGLAYRAERLPKLVITDRRHRARVMLEGLATYEGRQFEEALNQRLEEEPE